MIKFVSLFIATVGAMLVISLQPALAQLPPRTWVKSGGNDFDPCSRLQPCATFQAAHNANSSGGEINCVGPGSFGPLTITKAISIVCDYTQAGILTLGNGIVINAAAGDSVTLRGIDIDGVGSGTAGIVFQSGAALHVQKVRIKNFRATGGAGSGGLYFQPDAYAELYVADSYITDNGVSGQLSGGIVITPGSSGSVNAFLNRVLVENNSIGINVNGTRSTGVAVNAIVRDAVIAGSGGNGLLAISSSGKAAISVVVDGSKLATNFQSGINSNGVSAGGQGSAMVRVGNSTVANNVTGVSTNGAGVVQSFKNNQISGNLTDGTPIPAFPGPGGTPLQ